MTPYFRGSDAFAEGDGWGFSVAHDELVRSVLKYGRRSRGLHFFLRNQRELNHANTVLPDLAAEFPEKTVRWSLTQDLPTKTDESYVFTVPMEMTPQLTWFRRLLGGHRFNVTGLTHAIPDHGRLSVYCLMKLFCESHDTIVATSSSAERTVRTLLADAAEVMGGTCRARGSSPRVVSIPLGVETDSMIEGRDEMQRRELDLEDSAIVFLYVGRFSETYKGDLEPLLVCFSRVIQQRPNQVIRLVLAGKTDPAREQELRSLVAALNLHEHVRFVPNFPYKRKLSLYRASDIFISVPDNIQETFGLAVLDSMSCGLPCIVSDWSGYRDLVIDGDTGFLVPTYWDEQAGRSLNALAAIEPNIANSLLARRTIVDTSGLEDRMKLLIDNQGLRLAMGAAARSRACQLFDHRSVVQRYEDLWIEQEEERQCVAETSATTTEKHPGYARAFAHFASSQDVGCGREANQIDVAALEALRVAYMQRPGDASTLLGLTDLSNADDWLLRKKGLYTQPLR